MTLSEDENIFYVAHFLLQHPTFNVVQRVPEAEAQRIIDYANSLQLSLPPVTTIRTTRNSSRTTPTPNSEWTIDPHKFREALARAVKYLSLSTADQIETSGSSVHSTRSQEPNINSPLSPSINPSEAITNPPHISIPPLTSVPASVDEPTQPIVNTTGDYSSSQYSQSSTPVQTASNSFLPASIENFVQRFVHFSPKGVRPTSEEIELRQLSHQLSDLHLSHSISGVQEPQSVGQDLTQTVSSVDSARDAVTTPVRPPPEPKAPTTPKRQTNQPRPGTPQGLIDLSDIYSATPSRANRTSGILVPNTQSGQAIDTEIESTSSTSEQPIEPEADASSILQPKRDIPPDVARRVKVILHKRYSSLPNIHSHRPLSRIGEHTESSHEPIFDTKGHYTPSSSVDPPTDSQPNSDLGDSLTEPIPALGPTDTDMSASGGDGAAGAGSTGNGPNQSGSGTNTGNFRLDESAQQRIGEYVAAFRIAMGNLNDTPIGKLIEETTKSQTAQREYTERKSHFDGWKLTDIGYFHPDLPSYMGTEEIVHIGREANYRSVVLFVDAVRDAALVNKSRAERIQAQLHELYKGQALSWWTAQLSVAEREKMKRDPDYHLQQLFERFKISEAAALENLAKAHYNKEDCLKNIDIRTWATELVRNCRCAGMNSSVQHISWIYNKLDPKLKALVPAPTTDVTLDEYLKLVTERQNVWRQSLLADGNKDLTPTPGLNDRFIKNMLVEPKMIANFGESLDATIGNTNGNDDAEAAYWGNRGGGKGDFKPRFGKRNDDKEDDKSKDKGKDKGYDKKSYDRKSFGRRSYDNNRRGFGGFRFRNNRYQNGKQYPRRRWRRWIRTGKRGDSYAAEEQLLEWEQPDREDREKLLEAEGYVMIEEGELTDLSSNAESDSNYFSRPPNVNLDKRTCSKCGKLFDNRTNCLRHVFANSCVPPTPPGTGPHSRSRSKFSDTALKSPPNYEKPSVEDEIDAHFGQSQPQDLNDPILDAAQSDTATAFNTTNVEIIEAVPTRKTHKDVFKRYSSLEVDVLNNSNMSTICVDSGASHCMVDQAWLENFVGDYGTFQPDEPMVAGGISGSVSMTEKATFHVNMIAKPKGTTQQLIRVKVEAWIHRGNLRPNLLLGSEFCDNYGIVIDYPKTRMTIQSCVDKSIPIRIHKKHNFRRKVIATADLMIPPNAMLPIPVYYAELPSNRDFMFTSAFPGAMHSIHNAASAKAVAFINNSDKPVFIHKKTKLGSIGELEDNGYFETTWEKANMAQATATNDYADCENESEFLTAEFDLSPDLEEALKSMSTTPEDIKKLGVEKKSRLGVIPPSLGAARPEDAPAVTTKDGVHCCTANTAFGKKLVALAEKWDVWRDKGIIPLPEDEKMTVDLIDNWQDQYRSGRVYPLGVKDREFLDETFDKMHREGKLEWMRKPTPFACPCFVVWKTVDGKRKGRVVIDLRALNKNVLADAYPLPRQEEIVRRIRGKRFMSVVDGSAFFHQLPVADRHRYRMVVISPRGLEVSNVILMGFRNSPAFAQRFMDQRLTRHDKYAKAYIDDIVIFSDTEKDHLRHLEAIFRMCAETRLALAPKKSFLGYSSIRLLGFAVDGDGIATTPDRVEALRKMKMPVSLADLEKYIGMTVFLRKYVPWYNQKIEPLQDRKTALLTEGRKENKIPPASTARRAYTSRTSFTPTSAEKESFEILQAQLTETSYLAHWNFDATTFVKIDASKERGFGVMIFHLEGDSWDGRNIPVNSVQPVMYLSKVLTKAETRYQATELEVACLVWVCRQHRVQLQSCTKPVVILTDHGATRGIVNQTTLRTADVNKMNTKLMVASTFLSQFQLDVRYIPGRLNLVPDALSRLPTKDTPTDIAERNNPTKSELEDVVDDFGYYSTEIKIDDGFKQRIIEGYDHDKRLRRLREILVAAKLQRKDTEKWYRHILKDGLMYHVADTGQRRLCVPSTCVKELLEAIHDNKHHFGPKRMIQDLDGVSIQNMSRKVREYVNWCPNCQDNKTDRTKPLGELKPIKSPAIPYHTVAWDFIIGLPRISSKGSFWAINGHTYLDSLMVITCKFSKKCILIPGNTTYTAEEWALLVLRAFQLYDWGIPAKAISDRDSKFMSLFWQTIFNRLGTLLAMSTAWHPQTDGQSERKNQDIEIAIRYHCAALPSEPWINILPALQHNHNNAKSSVLGRSPNEVVYGFKPRDIISTLEVPQTAVDFDTLRKLYQKEAKAAIDFAAADAKARYDAKHNPISFNIGDSVYLRLHKGYNLPGKPPRKWSQQRVGPLSIVRRVGELAYELNLPTHWRIHKVISVAHLFRIPQGADPYGRRIPQPGRVIVQGDNDDWVSYEIEQLLNRRVNRAGGRPVLEYLVRWKGFSAVHDQWYPRELLMQNATELVDVYDKKHPLDLEALKAKPTKAQEADIVLEQTNTSPKPTDISTPKPTDINTPKPTDISTPRPTDIGTPKPAGIDTTVSKDWKIVDIIPKTNIEVIIPQKRIAST